MEFRQAWAAACGILVTHTSLFPVLVSAWSGDAGEGAQAWSQCSPWGGKATSSPAFIITRHLQEENNLWADFGALSKPLLFELIPSLVSLNTPKLLLPVKQGCWGGMAVPFRCWLAGESSGFKGLLKSDDGSLPPSGLPGPVCRGLFSGWRSPCRSRPGAVLRAVARGWRLGQQAEPGPSKSRVARSQDKNTGLAPWSV